MGGVTVLVFSGKQKIDPKIFIFVLLLANVAQKRKNAIASVRSPLAIDASPREHLRCVRSVQTREANAQITLNIDRIMIFTLFFWLLACVFSIWSQN